MPSYVSILKQNNIIDKLYVSLHHNIDSDFYITFGARNLPKKNETNLPIY